MKEEVDHNGKLSKKIFHSKAAFHLSKVSVDSYGFFGTSAGLVSFTQQFIHQVLLQDMGVGGGGRWG